jgi:hypothetical protein
MQLICHQSLKRNVVTSSSNLLSVVVELYWLSVDNVGSRDLRRVQSGSQLRDDLLLILRSSYRSETQ